MGKFQYVQVESLKLECLGINIIYDINGMYIDLKYPCGCKATTLSMFIKTTGFYLKLVDIIEGNKCIIELPCGCKVVGSFIEYLNILNGVN